MAFASTTSFMFTSVSAKKIGVKSRIPTSDINRSSTKLEANVSRFFIPKTSGADRKSIKAAKKLIMRLNFICTLAIFK